MKEVIKRLQHFLDQPDKYGAQTYVGEAYTVQKLRQDLILLFNHWDKKLDIILGKTP